jgi:hypothetical protein
MYVYFQDTTHQMAVTLGKIATYAIMLSIAQCMQQPQHAHSRLLYYIDIALQQHTEYSMGTQCCTYVA